jgi:hypothetical protein
MATYQSLRTRALYFARVDMCSIQTKAYCVHLDSKRKNKTGEVGT